jgi:hypothetical protein
MVTRCFSSIVCALIIIFRQNIRYKQTKTGGTEKAAVWLQHGQRRQQCSYSMGREGSSVDTTWAEKAEKRAVWKQHGQRRQQCGNSMGREGRDESSVATTWAEQA